MSDATVGAFVIFGSVGFGLLVVSIVRVSIGMTLTALILGLSGIAVFVSAKSVMHETLGGVLIVGGALCAGIAGLSRQINAALAASRAGEFGSPQSSMSGPNRPGWKEPAP